MKRKRQLCDGLLVPVIGAGGLWIGTAMAGEPAPVMVEPVDPEPAKSRFEEFADKLWSIPVLYENEANDFVQKIALIGRYQGQYAYTEGNTGDNDEWENRRFRFGVMAEFFHQLEFQAQVNLQRDSDAERFVENIEETTLEWTPSEHYYLSVGKQKAKITQEWATSSRTILTFERSLLVNQVHPDKIWGVVGGMKRGGWMVEGGVYTAELDGDWDWPEFDAGYGISGRVGYDVTANSKARLDYFYQDGDAGNNAVEPYEHLFSLNSTSKWDGWGLNTDLIYAVGEGTTPDVYGVIVMPWYDLTERLRLVGRYQYAGGDGSRGIRLQSRYERPAVDDGSSQRGDDYHAIYAGLNYYLYGDKLKLMVGGEWSTLGGDADWDGWTFLTGVRMYF